MGIKIAEENAIRTVVLIVVVLLVVFLIGYGIYLVATEKDVMYNLCVTIRESIGVIPGVNPGIAACSGLR